MRFLSGVGSLPRLPGLDTIIRDNRNQILSIIVADDTQIVLCVSSCSINLLPWLNS